MKFFYDEKKTTQAGHFFLEKEGGGIKYMKLIKLMYLADREALKNWSAPITGDRYVSMKYGPVLSEMYSHITQSDFPRNQHYWDNHISEPEDYGVHSRANPGIGQLSKREIELLDTIYKQYGHLDQWQLSTLTHDFPEWSDPKGSMVPIEYETMLGHLGKTEEEIQEIRDDLETHAEIDEILNVSS